MYSLLFGALSEFGASSEIVWLQNPEAVESFDLAEIHSKHH
ncbi:hypothetical protein [Psychromonas ingrahamii]|nr:hypothetical protein [Psychromonas ingrahamii]